MKSSLPAAVPEKIQALETVLSRQPGNTQAMNALVRILEKTRPLHGGTYVQAALKLSNHRTDAESLHGLLPEAALASAMREWYGYVRALKLLEMTNQAQLFSGRVMPALDGKPTNCNQLLTVFAKTGAILSPCFGCYKVQILPQTVVGLLQTHFLLKILDLPGTNMRKAMIELREDIKGPYKGYIYCGSEKEAHESAVKFKALLNVYGIQGIKVGVSHGCSEYSLAHPEFRYSSDGSHREFGQREEWRAIEDQAKPQLPKVKNGMEFDRPPFLTLQQMLGFGVWISYARAIGDPSVAIFKEVPSTRVGSLVTRIASQSVQRKRELGAD